MPAAAAKANDEVPRGGCGGVPADDELKSELPAACPNGTRGHIVGPPDPLMRLPIMSLGLLGLLLSLDENAVDPELAPAKPGTDVPVEDMDVGVGRKVERLEAAAAAVAAAKASDEV